MRQEKNPSRSLPECRSLGSRIVPNHNGCMSLYPCRSAHTLRWCAEMEVDRNRGEFCFYYATITMSCEKYDWLLSVGGGCKHVGWGYYWRFNDLCHRYLNIIRINHCLRHFFPQPHWLWGIYVPIHKPPIISAPERTGGGPAGGKRDQRTTTACPNILQSNFHSPLCMHTGFHNCCKLFL